MTPIKRKLDISIDDVLDDVLNPMDKAAINDFIGWGFKLVNNKLYLLEDLTVNCLTALKKDTQRLP